MHYVHKPYVPYNYSTFKSILPVAVILGGRDVDGAASIRATVYFIHHSEGTYNGAQRMRIDDAQYRRLREHGSHGSGHSADRIHGTFLVWLGNRAWIGGTESGHDTIWFNSLVA